MLALWSGMIISCTATRPGYNPANKIPGEVLQKDYTLFRKILEEGHPSLYWYTPKDSLDYYFTLTQSLIKDSMTEPEFKVLLSYMISKINCGHTAVRYSKAYSRYLDTVRMKQFPLSIKFWNDTAVVYANLNRKDSVLRRGTLIKSINGKPLPFYRDSLFRFLTMDGHGEIHKYQTLSNRGNFSGWYRNVFGLSNRFTIGYADSTGKDGQVVIPVYDPRRDSNRLQLIDFKKPGRRERRQYALQSSRELKIDTAAGTAYMTVNTFLRGNGIGRFFRTSFKKFGHLNIPNLVIDVRSNGGGNVGLSTLLTRYISDHSFKLADSLYAIRKKSKYGSLIQHHFWHRLSMNFIAKKHVDGKYHYGYFERHYFKPVKNYHYNGNIYVLTGGNSFSATTLFANAIKGQRNVLLVGEETGGAAYGNTAWLIPDVTLPNTNLRFLLPKFRMVVNKDAEKDGKGVKPDIYVGPSVESIRRGTDPKMEKVKEIIREKNKAVIGLR